MWKTREAGGSTTEPRPPVTQTRRRRSLTETKAWPKVVMWSLWGLTKLPHHLSHKPCSRSRRSHRQHRLHTHRAWLRRCRLSVSYKLGRQCGRQAAATAIWNWIFFSSNFGSPWAIWREEDAAALSDPFLSLGRMMRLKPRILAHHGQFGERTRTLRLCLTLFCPWAEWCGLSHDKSELTVFAREKSELSCPMRWARIFYFEICCHLFHHAVFFFTLWSWVVFPPTI